MVPSDTISRMDNTNTQNNYHSLTSSWTLWIHLYNVGWSLSNCLKIDTFVNIEQCIAVSESLSDGIIKNCMLFIMR